MRRTVSRAIRLTLSRGRSEQALDVGLVEVPRWSLVSRRATCGKWRVALNALARTAPSDAVTAAAANNVPADQTSGSLPDSPPTGGGAGAVRAKLPARCSPS